MSSAWAAWEYNICISRRRNKFGPFHQYTLAAELSQLEQPTTKQADRDASGGHLGPAVPSATEGKPFSGLLWDKDDSWFDPSDTAKVRFNGI